MLGALFFMSFDESKPGGCSLLCEFLSYEARGNTVASSEDKGLPFLCIVLDNSSPGGI
jgi:hypothetical protein